MTEAIKLERFCANGTSWNRTLRSPFSRGDWTYATDGKMIVRAPRIADVPEIDDAPHAERIWPAVLAETFRPAIDARLPPDTHVECDVCGGRGTKHDCPTCACKCEECSGTGELLEMMAVTVGIRDIQLRYAKLLLSLPWPQIAEPLAEDFVLQFRFDGGEGLISLMKRSHALPVVGEI